MSFEHFFQSLKNQEPNSEICNIKCKIKHILHYGVSLFSQYTLSLVREQV